jgi:hypothetical protein
MNNPNPTSTVQDNSSFNYITVINTDSNNIEVVQPITNVVQIATGPLGPVGPQGPSGSIGPSGSQGPIGPTGSSAPFTYVGNNVWNTTSSIQVTGSLTLSSGSALSINNGFYVDGNRQFNYGQFSSTQTQSGSADTAYSATFDIIDFSQGVSLVSGSRITISNTGLYNIQFSSQLHTTANQSVDFSIWFAMTGSNIDNSNTDFTVEKIAGGGYAVAALNFLTRIASGSYIELKYSKTTLQGQLLAKGIQSTPTRPATPSVILTVTQIV